MHGAIVDAIADRNPAAAEDAMADHLRAIQAIMGTHASVPAQEEASRPVPP
jgi:Transcriptional regulators